LLKRLPLRLRLTLLFTGVMALVLAATGIVLYERLASDLDHTLDQGLRSSADNVLALVQQSDQGLAQAGHLSVKESGEAFAQVIGPRGRVIDATPQVKGKRLLTPAEVARAEAGTLSVARREIPGLEEPARLLATPVRAQDQRLVVVVGESLAQRDEALSGLGSLLLVGGPVVLLLASLAGYGLAGAALRPLEAIRARERQFVADASHELLTPVAILHTELELAAGRPDGEAKQALRSATEETARLTALAQDLLLLAQSDEKGLQLRGDPIAARELLAGVAARFRRRAADAGREIAVDAPADLEVRGDRLRLEQALGSLLDNALRHGQGDVTVSARNDNGAVELHVEDRGPGLPEAFAAHAFERFTRASPAADGSGLGLAIVAAIARAHGGEAHTASRSDGGADAWLALPLNGS
jgi:signal transduction histidine kinase